MRTSTYSMTRGRDGRPVLVLDGQDVPGNQTITLKAGDVARLVDAFTGYGYKYAQAEAAQAPAKKVAELLETVAKLEARAQHKDQTR